MTESTISSLAEFIASRRKVENVNEAIDAGDDAIAQPGFIYADSFYLLLDEDGTVRLQLPQSEETAPLDEIEGLESKLYDYAVAEGEVGSDGDREG